MLLCITKKSVSALLLLCLFLNFSCKSENNSLQERFGNDSYYFRALKCLEANDEKEAARLFSKCVEKGSVYTARRSAEELTKIGNIQDRISACERLFKTFSDEQSLLLYATELYSSKEYAEVIAKTEGIDITTCNNNLARLRINALREKADNRLDKVIYEWLVSRPFSQEHINFFGAYQDILSGLGQRIIQVFRMTVGAKNYPYAAEQIPKVIETIKNDESLLLNAQLISDMGKAYLYGSTDWIKNAKFFENLAQNTASESNAENAYYAWFYAARLYEKEGNYYTRSSQCFLKAMECAQNAQQYDNALWYLLDLELGISTKRAIASLENYCSTWNDSLYFEDFFETLSVHLLSHHEWNDFYMVYNIIKDYADESICAKYAYLSGRLIQAKLAKAMSEDAASEATNLFSKALNSGSDIYYKILAAERLDLGEEQIDSLMETTKINRNFVEDKSAENLLLGFAAYGFPQKIYDEWNKLCSANVSISLECNTTLAKFIRESDPQSLDNFYKSLRIASNAVNLSDKPLTKEALRLAYPQNFADYISLACDEFGVDKFVMYALVRTESFFNPEIKSIVGAVGLAQLMETTGQDIAKRLKVENYSLTDPKTNIRFGTYYLNNLTERLDSVLLAIFAYNSGITRVRRWLSNSKKELEMSSSPPMDLFLETIPFSETRDYGRKVVAGAATYAWLYEDISPVKTVRTLMK